MQLIADNLVTFANYLVDIYMNNFSKETNRNRQFWDALYLEYDMLLLFVAIPKVGKQYGRLQMTARRVQDGTFEY